MPHVSQSLVVGHPGGEVDERRVTRRFHQLRSGLWRRVVPVSNCSLEQLAWLEICNGLVPQEGSKLNFHHRISLIFCDCFYRMSLIIDCWMLEGARNLPQVLTSV